MSSKKKADKKTRGRSSPSNTSVNNTVKLAPADQGDVALESPQPDHSLSSSSTLQNASKASIVIQMDDPALSPRFVTASSPGYRATPDNMQGSPALVDHQHPEPSIGERFGRRHGQDWPAHTSQSSNKCAYCPGSRSESRSKSRGGMRRTSGILYKAIPVRPIIGAPVFQSARKSEQVIGAIKGMPRVQEFYRAQNELLDRFAEVEEVLKEHREEEELAKTQGYPQLPPMNMSTDGTPGYPTRPDYQTTDSYGSIAASSVLAAPAMDVVHEQSQIIVRPAYDQENGATGDDDEEAPLFEYKRRQKTSPHLVQLAINISFVANIFLVILKIWTVLLSDSLAVLASMIDSLMDLLSGAIIWYSARLRNNTSDGHRYPVGKARMEPLGIIVFAAVMVTSFMQVMLQSFERLLAGSEEPPVDLGVIILVLLALNILVKTALWLWCRTMKDSASVLALAQDHLNDVVFNVFSTLFPVAGQFLSLWWLDAAGAILLSIYIISEWTGTCLHNIRRLTGQAASSADIQQLTYMAYRFSNTIQEIDTVRAYSVGEGLFVEIDIVLPPDTPLSQAHDLGESLQGALERLDSVERAFVHIDYNAVHAIEHTSLRKP
ncbi:hypothetical protein BGZ52_002571 [Haplosporangium bisporale]|uniref:Uncharacterized protein n=1 Tax=Podila verticillata NRRL 6337 TaxID=1069443 RepID=A0A086TK03_9FUNG|nr:hypothetical protein BGZ52_002571 [Haplosporangium bisporale]KFH62280.1 hypothetical protein MVEG_11491 [Podila verticillata NRRL 6337]